MLTALNIRDFILIDRAQLTLAHGLAALTGETGAGKSILLDALGLAVGGRATRGGVRQGAAQGVVAATFEVDSDHPVWQLLDDNGLAGEDGAGEDEAGEDGQIILRRVQNADGRSRGFVNDQPVSISMLRDVGEALLEIHGQHDGRGFLSASAHRGMLDEFGGLQKKAAKISSLWRAWREAQSALEERRREQGAAAREAEYLRHVYDVLQNLNPQAGEETALAERRAVLIAAEKVSEQLHATAAAIDDGRVEHNLATGLGHVERAAALLPQAQSLKEAAARFAAALSEAAEGRAAIDRAISEFGADPDEVDRTEERLFELRGEARKHGVAPDALCEFLQKITKALDDVEAGTAAFADLERAAAAAKSEFASAAMVLSKDRAKAAKKLDAAVAKELAPLKLGKAHFETQVISDPDNPTSDGYDRAEFMVTTNPGAPAGPLKTIASGGELSRFVLAMKAALAAKENRTVIIFDEVDAGVGGAVADAVGERLARLAQDAQVLVVTHSPQVAARAQSHWRIEKNQTKSRTTTSVALLDAEDRVEEIARMLSGAKVTNEARAAARQLLGGAAKKPTAKKPARKKLAPKKLAKTG
jgi:DNA repair protein RecN (Recombination protein N)